MIKRPPLCLLGTTHRVVIGDEAVERVRLARDLRDVLREDIEVWMDLEAMSGRVRQNGDAPMWRQYEEAERALAEAVEAL